MMLHGRANESDINISGMIWICLMLAIHIFALATYNRDHRHIGMYRQIKTASTTATNNDMQDCATDLAELRVKAKHIT